MAKIGSFFGAEEILFELDFLDTEGFIYCKEQADYLNWIPCKIEVITKNEKCKFLKLPTLSVEGIKALLNKFQQLFDEKESLGHGFEYMDKARMFDYTATEGEFEICFKNTIDEEDLVEMSIWMYIAFCNEDANDYWTGFRFCVSLNELKIFIKEIKHKLFILTGGRM